MPQGHYTTRHPGKHFYASHRRPPIPWYLPTLLRWPGMCQYRTPSKSHSKVLPPSSGVAGNTGWQREQKYVSAHWGVTGQRGLDRLDTQLYSATWGKQPRCTLMDFKKKKRCAFSTWSPSLSLGSVYASRWINWDRADLSCRVGKIKDQNSSFRHGLNGWKTFDVKVSNLFLVHMYYHSH